MGWLFLGVLYSSAYAAIGWLLRGQPEPTQELSAALPGAGRLVNLRQFGGGNRLPDALQARRRNSDAISYSDNLVLSSQVVNQLRFQYSQLAPSFKTSGDNKPVVLITLNDPSLSGTLVAGSSTLGGSDRREQRAQLQEILSFVSGSHSLKFGVDLHPEPVLVGHAW